MRARTLALAAVAVVAIGAAAGGLACESALGVDFGAQHLSACTPATPPASNGGADTGTNVAFTAIVSSVDWGDTDDADGHARARSIGYDLDGRCTSQFDQPPCEPATWTGVEVIDGVNGIDNAIGMLLHDQMEAFGAMPFVSTKQTALLQSGTAAPPAMFRVSDYSGGTDDGVVTVEWLVPVALGSPPTGKDDVFSIASGTADAMGDGGAVVSRYVDHAAYIQASTLVAHFPSGPPLVISDVPVKTTDTLLTAQVEEVGNNHFALHQGILAGHGSLPNLFDVLAALSSIFVVGPPNPDASPDAAAPFAVCKDTPTIYPHVKAWLCGHADWTTTGGPSCDAASFGVAFDTQSAQVGPIAPPPQKVMYCKPGEDPAGETCDTPP